MTTEDLTARQKSLDDVPARTHRGGSMRLLFGPASGCADGLFGVLDLGPGEVFREHYHPFSEECLFVVSGSVVVGLDGDYTPLDTGGAIRIPRHVRHRVLNESAAPARVVFGLYGIAPSPELGHVETEVAGVVNSETDTVGMERTPGDGPGHKGTGYAQD
ncbi:cupin domain-containing protein [Nocardia sp. NPDC051570]|uniref:cupin domain-containing protein n=1 Tax=Nocardia sp. NPDC051570 TaxID=3364324 RepID=UPI00379CBB4F